MAGITFYNVVFPTLIRAVKSLEAILTKAQAHAKENGIDFDAEYAPAKLAEDMLPLTFSVYLVAKMPRQAIAKFTGVTAEPFDDGAKTFDQMLAELKKSLEMLQQIRPEDVNGKEGDETSFETGPVTHKMAALDYVNRFLMPNVYFHLQATYSILRMKGVPLGKLDYLKPFMVEA